jgi:hypothetical protein
MGNMGSAVPGGYPPHDLRGQGGGDRDSHQLPDEGLAQAKYEAEVDAEAGGRRRPGLIERFKRWFSSRY